MKSKARRSHLHLNDLRGASRLSIDAVLGITSLVEAMHATIAQPALPLGNGGKESARGISGLVYRSIRGVTRLVGGSIETVLQTLAPAIGEMESSEEREAVRAAINGVVGDHLLASNNPLAIPMQLRCDGIAVPLTKAALASKFADAGGRVAILVHGLCMNDLQWRRNGHDHGQLLRDAGMTTLYLHYNTGRHVSENARDFAHLLNSLFELWPVPITELNLLCHSMGGLVTRSACHVAGEEGLPWLTKLGKLMFLGTPHHGAPMEQGGNWIDIGLQLSPYSKAFSRLTKVRSSGITDLRHGNLLDADWHGRDRFQRSPPPASSVPLPAKVACYAAAATMAKDAADCQRGLLGDGLVMVPSALGKHKNPARSLRIPAARQWVGYGMNHWDLLSRPEVAEQIHNWLAEPSNR